MVNVIAVIDIGKTNKKILLFNEEFDVVYRNATRFDEVSDEDDYPCDDIESIENWIQNEIKRIQAEGDYAIKAINFSTHGASLIYLDDQGNRITPLYNYLKPLSLDAYHEFYDANGGQEEFSRKTASPAYGMLNTGLQILKLQKEKPEFWNKVDAILHYPQYLSYLFTKQITADFTSVGAHTATWDFDTMQYHQWVSDYKLNLPTPQNGKEAIITTFNGEEIAIGTGLHDSSASIIPLLETEKDNEFILLSTGTWIIAMNPFSKETLTQHQLKNNCLCFMTPQKQQIKSSMQFLGKIHEVYITALSSYFKIDIDTHLHLELNETLCKALINTNARVFLSEGIDSDFEAHPYLLTNYTNYETAYYQLIFEISKKVIQGINLISDENSAIKDVYISGGFNKNVIFISFLKLLKNDIEIKISDCKNESALGAALMMKSYIKSN
ncbi:Rhamnulokinase RhaK in alpha-proteobacteria [Winogradskyella psychrotolerans RS-3]|uniref:Rhamnulokinase RhaK in alpha-proteobacteria n=1 Tax=Winogradskyella psychrotolerans RS-3 TaxID=641526 RepID=S7WUM3_9FLAO|nr:FGGY family carbohydrate kinase [Winogradskyella psychrotolerans]EPR70454.1 Rhamnulokinase RhaK in alpha-proteobacteria [Winogradskyella psychrotolerans RS-3]